MQEQITELLRQRHRIGPGRDDDFIVRTQQEITEMATATSQDHDRAAGGHRQRVAAGRRHRHHEHHARERDRAHPRDRHPHGRGRAGRDILLQFLIEAVTLSVVGGLVGIGLGLGISRTIAVKMNWPVLTSSNAIVLAFVFSAAVGIFFGFYPARKASASIPSTRCATSDGTR